MDYLAALEELYQERKRLDTVIRNLEALTQGRQPPPLSTRGRKSMSDEERKAVAERMRRYWASRRKPADPEPPID
jgi:hypothetical protein